MASATVLVVEDEANVAFVISSALRLAGLTVIEAVTGRDALHQAAQYEVDLAVLDVMLPDIDGFEVCQRLRAGGFEIPIIFLTARDATPDRVRGLTIGGDDYLTKPFSVEELVARVRAVLRRAGKSPTEYKLLRFLLRNTGRVMTKTQILDHVWDYDFAGESTVVETFVSTLRKKVDSEEPRLIQTVRGVGYRLTPP